MIFRSDNRTPEQLRPVNIIPDFISTAEGSALIEMGNTRVICTASVEETVPPFLHSCAIGQGMDIRRIRDAAAINLDPHRARIRQG